MYRYIGSYGSTAESNTDLETKIVRQSMLLHLLQQITTRKEMNIRNVRNSLVMIILN